MNLGLGPVRRFHRETIDLLAVKAPKPRPARTPEVSYEAAIEQFVQSHVVVRFAPSPTSGQYSQTAGTKRKASPATATWQTDGNGR